MKTIASSANDHADDHVDAEIDTFLNLDAPKSFFLFAGAGSGKTKSVEKALRTLRNKSGSRMRLRGQQVAVITYTNAACDELIRRVEFDSLFSISTIHSFIWNLIQGFNHDIRAWLKGNLAAEKNELELAQAKGKKSSQAAIDRAEKILAVQNRFEKLDNIAKFTYSPSGENRTRDSLSHAEVIKLGAFFLTAKPLMQRLLTSKFPILLIDESQDTNRLLMDAFFAVQSANSQSFCLGLIGDTMQRIYSDGAADLGANLPPDWGTPSKILNHRCPHRIVRLINKIRSEVDTQQQRGRSDAIEGHVHVFIASNNVGSKSVFEQTVRERMAMISGDNDWNLADNVKTLILEHHMAAQRMGFLDMFKPLDRERNYKTALRDGSLPFLGFFSKLILPLVIAKRTGNEFAVAALVREESPLLSKQSLSAPNADQAAQIAAAKAGVDALIALFGENSQPTFLQVLKSIAHSKLFAIPEALVPFISDNILLDPSPVDPNEPPEEEQESKSLAAVRSFLDTAFAQIEHYDRYIRDNSRFATHQGVKGLEFPRVEVILDDSSAGGFLFNFDKLFGATEKTTTDLKNEQEGMETGIDRTRRLLYVTCSRSQRSLALIAYSSDPEKVRATLLNQGWFEDGEIELLKS